MALREVWEKCSDISRVHKAIIEVDSLVKTPRGDRLNNKLPFYLIYLSYSCFLVNDILNARSFAERAINGFILNRQKQNQAIGRWILSIFLCLYEQLDEARAHRDKSISMVKSLIDDLFRSGEYKIQNNEYQLEDIVTNLEQNYERIETQLMDRLLFKQGKPFLHFDFFTKVAVQQLIPEELGYINDWIVHIAKSDVSEFQSEVSFLGDLHNRLSEIPENTQESALLNFLLGHLHNMGYYANSQEEEKTEAEAHVREALTIMNNNDDVNRFLTSCYLALLYYNEDTKGTGRLYLKDAGEYIEYAITEYQNQNITEGAIELRNLHNELQSWTFPFDLGHIGNQAIKNLFPKHVVESSSIPSSRKARTLSNNAEPKSALNGPASFFKNLLGKQPNAHDETPFIKDGFSVPRVKLKEGKKKDDSSTPPPSTPGPTSQNAKDPNIRHLIIPIDVSALNDEGTELIPLEHDDFQRLEIFETQKVHPNNKDEQPVANRSASPQKRVILIPSFPIYGFATAGPNGEAQLPDPDGLETVGAIQDTLEGIFAGETYKVGFIDSPVPSFAPNKRYGWFKITGYSMTKAGIEPNDYVLFRENRNLESCAKKVVIALAADLETQPPRVTVKRLVKMSGEVPCNDDGFGPELCKFVLHSESFLERDPKTSISFKRDIEIENDHQLIGDVIAIAKRT